MLQGVSSLRSFYDRVRGAFEMLASNESVLFLKFTATEKTNSSPSVYLQQEDLPSLMLSFAEQNTLTQNHAHQTISSPGFHCGTLYSVALCAPTSVAFVYAACRRVGLVEIGDV